MAAVRRAAMSESVTFQVTLDGETWQPMTGWNLIDYVRQERPAKWYAESESGKVVLGTGYTVPGDKVV